MTVNEIEARTGLDRGTVRYYEAEGLIRPAREANGYRNYSQDDLEKLLKVKLLRALNFSVDDIRAMDGDAGDFADRLRARMRSLEARQEDIGDLKRVLGMMLSDGAEYASLDSGLYLRSIQERPPEIAQAPEDEKPQPAAPVFPVPGPWRRYLARSMDIAILELIFMAVAVLVFRAPVGMSLVTVVVQTAVTELAMLFLEPACLALFGTTPGKAILGIRVTAPDGGNLTYREGLRRTWGALLMGTGLGIPLLGQVFMFGCYRDARRGVRMVWDRDFRVELRDGELWRNLAFGGAGALVVAVTVWVFCLSLLPPNRGGITPAELAENVNRYFLSVHSTSDYPIFYDPGYRLRADGLWDDTGIWDGHSVTGDFYPSKVEITVEDGEVTALRWSQSVKDSGRGYYGRMGGYVSALVWGFVGSDGGFDIWDMRSIISKTDLAGFRGFSLELDGWSVKGVTHLSDSAEVTSGSIRFPDGETGEFGVELTITKK